MGGSNDADIATPINGPALPCKSANATPVPDGKAQSIPIHNDLACPLNKFFFVKKFSRGKITNVKKPFSPSFHFFRWPITESPGMFRRSH